MARNRENRTFQTPIEVCKYMVSLIPDGCSTVLEPTPGRGNIVSCLDEYEVTAPEDFFLLDRKLKFDCIIMNPPFSAKSTCLDNAPEEFKKMGMGMGYWFLNQCLQKSDYVIALMPWFTISDSDVRLRQLKRFGLKSITLLPRKTFDYVRMQTAIFELHKRYKGKTEFIVFDTIKDHSVNYLFNE